MNLSVGELHELYLGLSALNDPKVNIAVEVLLNVAINLSVIRPICAAYEQARARAMSLSMTVEAKSNPERESQFFEDDKKLREQKVDVSLQYIHLEGLKISENALRPLTLSQLLPVLAGVPGNPYTAEAKRAA